MHARQTGRQGLSEKAAAAKRILAMLPKGSRLKGDLTIRRLGPAKDLEQRSPTPAGWGKPYYPGRQEHLARQAAARPKTARATRRVAQQQPAPMTEYEAARRRIEAVKLAARLSHQLEHGE